MTDPLLYRALRAADPMLLRAAREAKKIGNLELEQEFLATLLMVDHALVKELDND